MQIASCSVCICTGSLLGVVLKLDQSVNCAMTEKLGFVSF